MTTDSSLTDQSEDIKNRSQIARTVIANIWKRARLNAFAHKVSAERFSKKGTRYFTWELFSAVLGILFVILVYLINSSDGNEFATIINKKLFAFIFLVLSIVFTLLSMILSVLQNVLKFEITAAEHVFLCGSYQYIAQRAREAHWPDMPYEQILELLRDIERDFQLLKARGKEPDDSCFDEATRLFKKIRNDEETKAAQSFDY